MINGKLYKYDLTPHSSSISVRIKNGRADGEMIVMDGLGNLFIQPKSRGSVHHSSFFSGGPVAYAGMLEVNEGEITKCINHSGHYLPTALEQESFELLQKTLGLLMLKANSIYSRIQRVNTWFSIKDCEIKKDTQKI